MIPDGEIFLTEYLNLARRLSEHVFLLVHHKRGELFVLRSCCLVAYIELIYLKNTF